ncbi:MAG: glycosyltransferase [Solirubrobacteraceae bacterium]
MVVCTRHRATVLARCLSSLANLSYPNYEVIVVDNSLGDPEAKRMTVQAGARYINEPNLGLSRARNVGARAASGEIVAFVDDDAVAHRDWLRHHATALDDVRLGATTGRILPGPGTPAHINGSLATGDYGDRAFSVDRRTPHWFEMANFGGIGNGGNMAFRRALFDEGLRFSEWLGSGSLIQGGEEHHAFFSVIQRGHAIAYIPAAAVYHDPPSSMSELVHRERAGLRNASAYVVMLLVEAPGFRGRTLRYASEAIAGARRPWRPLPHRAPLTTRRELALAAVTAPWVYARSRIRVRRVLGD